MTQLKLQKYNITNNVWSDMCVYVQTNTKLQKTERKEEWNKTNTCAKYKKTPTYTTKRKVYWPKIEHLHNIYRVGIGKNIHREKKKKNSNNDTNKPLVKHTYVFILIRRLVRNIFWKVLGTCACLPILFSLSNGNHKFIDYEVMMFSRP